MGMLLVALDAAESGGAYTPGRDSRGRASSPWWLCGRRRKAVGALGTTASPLLRWPRRRVIVHPGSLGARATNDLTSR